MSRTVLEVILLVLAVSVILMSFTPLGPFIAQGIGRLLGTSPAGHLQIMGAGVADKTSRYTYLVIYVRNVGPGVIGDPEAEITDVILSPTSSGTKWVAYVNGVECTPYCSNPNNPNRCSVRQHMGVSMNLDVSQIRELETNGAMETEPWRSTKFGS